MKKIYIAPKSISIEVESEATMERDNLLVITSFVDNQAQAYYSQPEEDHADNNFMGRKRGNSIWGDD